MSRWPRTARGGSSRWRATPPMSSPSRLLAAAQACDFHAPLRSSPALEAVRAKIRAAVPHLDEDRYLHADLAAAADLVTSGALADGLDLPSAKPESGR